MWEELEQPILRWAAEHESESLDFTWGESTSPLAPELADTQVDDGLLRLKQHGLVEGHRWEGSGASGWSQLRVTADALRVLGEWPPVEATSVHDALILVLRELADSLPDEKEATATRRAGSALGKMSRTAVWDSVKAKLRSGGEGLAA